jgi:hypothetical protein
MVEPAFQQGQVGDICQPGRVGRVHLEVSPLERASPIATDVASNRVYMHAQTSGVGGRFASGIGNGSKERHSFTMIALLAELTPVLRENSVTVEIIGLSSHC